MATLYELNSTKTSADVNELIKLLQSKRAEFTGNNGWSSSNDTQIGIYDVLHNSSTSTTITVYSKPYSKTASFGIIGGSQIPTSELISVRTTNGKLELGYKTYPKTTYTEMDISISDEYHIDKVLFTMNGKDGHYEYYRSGRLDGKLFHITANGKENDVTESYRVTTETRIISGIYTKLIKKVEKINNEQGYEYVGGYTKNENGHIGLPFYEWYKFDASVSGGIPQIWLYVKLSLRTGAVNPHSKNYRKNINGWINANVGALALAGASAKKDYKDEDTGEELTPDNQGNQEENIQYKYDKLTEWLMANFENAQYRAEEEYFTELYENTNLEWSTKSFKSIIGMPFHFMANVDPRVGASPLGKQFIEDIVYDMPIVCMRPGGPVMNSAIASDGKEHGILALAKKFLSYHEAFFAKHKSSFETLADEDDDSSFGGGDALKTILLNLFVGKYARFYTFGSDMYKYIEYVNTLCHLFISFLDIGDIKYKPGNGDPERKYAYYNDTWETCESDGGNSMKLMYGPNKAIFGYFQPESQLNQTYSNETRESELASTMDQGSSIAKEWHFLMGSAGINMMDANSIWNNLGGKLAGLNGNALMGRLFGNAAEGVSTVVCGQNLDLPEIWSDSHGGTEHTLIFKLVSPYGDRESIFLYVLRPLARLMAMSLPRQFGPNSYTSPFLIQAYSKGQFNVQCGIVSSLSIKRCGNGGESHTVSFIPTELEVTMVIQDMYDMVTLSNEYLGSKDSGSLLVGLNNVLNALNPFGAAKAARLLFNNIGLIDFCAAYCGFSLNSPEIDTMWTLVVDIWRNRINDEIENPFTTGVNSFKSPKWNRSLSDAFYSAVVKYTGFTSG